MRPHKYSDRPGHPKGVDIESPEDRRSPELSVWFVGGWLSPALVVGFLILWHLLWHSAIMHRPRFWEYGTMPYVPAQSVFTTASVPLKGIPDQVTFPPRPGGRIATP